jgi:hypothetical protein
MLLLELIHRLEYLVRLILSCKSSKLRRLILLHIFLLVRVLISQVEIF